MTNPTSNFGWQMPTSTDLVTDLPADFEVFGQAVDTSLADLKGGTTGQVLSKASNTNMDFTWVTSDDANAIQNTIVDAKGDLISATGSDVPARLAVGANYGFLQADSTTATGLAWNSGGWTGYTPTVSAASGSFTTVSSAGRYQRIGKTCLVEFTVNITTNGTAAAATYVTLPFTASGGSPTPYWVGACADFFVTGVNGFTRIGGGATFLSFSSYLGTYLGGNGYYIGGSITYEVA
jgi:hypothetical protein